MRTTNYTTWKPDTCECVITFKDEGREPHLYVSRNEHVRVMRQNGRSEAHISSVLTERICPKHRGKSGQELLDALLDENRRKNKIS